MPEAWERLVPLPRPALEMLDLLETEGDEASAPTEPEQSREIEQFREQGLVPIAEEQGILPAS